MIRLGHYHIIEWRFGEMKLHIQPLTALSDERIHMRIFDLPPWGKVQIRASMSFPWAKNVLYESEACFTADSGGHLDLSKQKPDSGSYDFIDSMGPILSLKRTKGKLKDVIRNISVNQSQFIDIIAECGQDSSSVRVERLFMSPELKSLEIHDEFVGQLFYTENSRHRTIIVLGGSSNEDLCTILPPSALLASHGFHVLALSFFGEKGLNSALAEIPLEYFEKVFAWLEKNAITHCQEIYVYGGSIGAVLALLLASRYPIITKVVAINPLAWCFQGLALKRVALWTYGGKSLPFIKFAWLSALAHIMSCFVKNKPFGFAYMYRKSLDIANNREAARIKMENSNADILLFGGQKDGWWDTHDACLEIMEELARHNYQHTYEYMTYENGGHACYAPFVIPVDEFSAPLKIAPRLVLSEGVSREANAHMLEDSWKKTIEFFKK
jgi:pimeloyl-ACP methyl ester carboxylesterase